MILLSILLSLIFFTLAMFHFIWAAGGSYGFAASLPTKETGERVLNPKKVDSAIVGLGLTAFGLFYVFKVGLFPYELPAWVIQYGGWIIPAVFILRSIGEFRYVGFFKRVKNTEFGRMDSRFYAPLCLGIGVAGVIVAVV